MNENNQGPKQMLTADMYEFLINGELLSVQKNFTDKDVFNTITLTVEQLNTFEWIEPDPNVTITVNDIAVENGRCDFALAEITAEAKISVKITQGGAEREILINTLNTHLPEIKVEGNSNTPGDFFLSFISTRSIVKTDNDGKIIFYRNEDGDDMHYGLWDFKAHQLGGKTYCFTLYGALVQNNYVSLDKDVYYLADKNGVQITKKGWHTVKTKETVKNSTCTTTYSYTRKYYMKKDGTLTLGFKKLDGKTYYFNPWMFSNTYVWVDEGDGNSTSYYFGKKGDLKKTVKGHYNL